MTIEHLKFNEARRAMNHILVTSPKSALEAQDTAHHAEQIKALANKYYAENPDETYPPCEPKAKNCRVQTGTVMQDKVWLEGVLTHTSCTGNTTLVVADEMMFSVYRPNLPFDPLEWRDCFLMMLGNPLQTPSTKVRALLSLYTRKHRDHLAECRWSVPDEISIDMDRKTARLLVSGCTKKDHDLAQHLALELYDHVAVIGYATHDDQGNTTYATNLHAVSVEEKLCALGLAPDEPIPQDFIAEGHDREWFKQRWK